MSNIYMPPSNLDRHLHPRVPVDSSVLWGIPPIPSVPAYSESRADRYGYRVNRQDNRICNGTTHILTCFHAVTLNTCLCSTNCRQPQYGDKVTSCHKCPTCAFKTDEEMLLEEVAGVDRMRTQLARIRNFHIPPPSINNIEVIEDRISEREISLQFAVSRPLWLLYSREGVAGVKAQKEARELEELLTIERRYIRLMRAEWYRQRVRYNEMVGEHIRLLVQTRQVHQLEMMIIYHRDLIRNHVDRARNATRTDLCVEEQARLDVEFARERLTTLLAAVVEARSLDPDWKARRDETERRRRVEILEFHIGVREESLAEWRQAEEARHGEYAFQDSSHRQEYDMAQRELASWRAQVERLHTLGLGDPAVHDAELGEV